MLIRRYRLWAVLVVLAPMLFVLVNVLWFNAMPKPKRLTQPLMLEYHTRSPEFERSLGALLQQPILPGNTIELLRDGEAIYAAKVDAIDRAEHSVSFETYEFWGAAAAGPIVEALARAAERGVAVNALPDYIGSREASPEKFARLSEAGVETYRWRKPAWYNLSRFNHRTHRKLLIIDGREAFTGGANVADVWLASETENPYRDNHFHIRGPVVASLQAAFAETWLDATGYLLEGDRYFPELESQGDYRAQVVNSAPREGRHRMRKLFHYAVAAAEESITAATAYFYPDDEYLAALIDAAERGVRVRILVPGKSIDQGYLRQASVNRWEAMLEAGVELYEYQPSMYHSKLMSVDDYWSSFGSTNLDNRSFRINDEANVNVYDEQFARKIRELIEEDMQDAHPYGLAEWRERSFYKRAWGWMGSVIGAYL
ncbi:phospholipase D-like domain-containing protein [Marinimicrobium alkaliphilum]|uniref:phospholipase D-like domain-containing protein n=1 Tax=Marinimicrobium alkaliphilum TaxID=2202654 RepID=UPI000DB9E7DE|nr:phospholipase D-like domain-containing protein [Marinimicrobium alkaliphilum]